MKPTPQASVLFLSCDQAEFVREAIRSILAQEGIVLEILVSDDASRDESYQILQREISVYNGPHTVVLESNPQRVGHENVYHLALKAACDFQIQAHSDDISHPQRCLKLWEAHRSTGASVVTSHREHLDVWSRSSPAADEGESRFHSAEQFFGTPQLAGSLGACPAWHRDIMTCFPPLTGSYLNTHRDCLCVMRGALLGGAYFVAEPLLKHRHHPSQGSVSIKWNPRFRDMLRTQHQMVWREAVLRDLEWALENKKTEAKIDQERFQTLYNQFELRFLELSRQQYRKIGEIKGENFLLSFVPAQQLSSYSIRLFKRISSGKVRRLFFWPRQLKRSLKTLLSSRQPK